MFSLISICKLLLFIPLTGSILDDDILYDIQWQPESTTPFESDNQLNFLSKLKESYSCILPTPQKIFSTSTDTVGLNEVESLLKGLYSKKLCTIRYDPYWIYEFCHGQYIRQYHEIKLAGKKTIVQEFFLGYYHADSQEIIVDADNKQMLKVHYKQLNDRSVPMLPVRYTDGTPCDINSNKPRETVIFYVCSDKTNDNIVHFQEVSSCQYEMIVASSWICKLPVFSPAEVDRYSIRCSPNGHTPHKPRNLRKLEKQGQQAMASSTGVQFTMTNADGTTLIISYDYAKDQQIDELGQKMKVDFASATTTPPPSNSDSDRQFLVKFFTGQQCLAGGSGWWRYEFCYGKQIIQFHDEHDQRTSIILGTWNREKHIELSTNNEKEKNVRNPKDEYVSLFYTNGDLCALTNQLRMVEVKLRCSRKMSTAPLVSMYLVEPKTCFYVLGVESTKFCNLFEYLDQHGIPNFERFSEK